MDRRGPHIALALIVLFALARYSPLADSPRAVQWLTDVAWTVAALASAVASMVAARHSRGLDRRAWLFIGAGDVAWLAGIVIWSWLQLFERVTVPFPSWGDAFFLAAPLLYVAGMFFFRDTTRGGTVDLAQIANLGIVGAAVLIVVPLWFVEPLRQRETIDLYAATAVAWPVLYLIAAFFSVICLAFYAHGRKRQVYLLLSCGIVAHAVVSCLYGYSLLSDTYETGAAFDLLWLVALSFNFLAALRQKAALERPAKDQPRDRTKLEIVEALLPAGILVAVLLTALLIVDRLDVASVRYGLAAGLVLAAFLGLRHWAMYREQGARAEDAIRISEALRASEERHRSLFDSSVDMIYVFDSGGRVVAGNPAWRRRMGYGEQDLSRLRREDILVMDSVLMAQIEERSRNGVFAGETTLVARDGVRFPAEVSVSQYIDAAGETIVCVIARDISDRKRHETALREAKAAAEAANASKSDFLANMSHELRTPLNAIIGFSQLIEGDTSPANRKHADYAQSIRSSGELLLQIINDLLDLSKLEAGKQSYDEEIVDIASTVASVTRILRPRIAECGLQLDIIMPRDLPSLRADERAMRQVFLNLLSNAVKFTPMNGRVGVEASLLADGTLQVVVSDTGIGIDEESLKRVFERFWRGERTLTRRFSGTGLGLAITKSILDVHEATIALASEKGKGTSVTICFPRWRTLHVGASPARAVG